MTQAAAYPICIAAAQHPGLPIGGGHGKSAASSLSANISSLEEMPPFNGHNFQDRQAEAANARKAQLEKFRSRPDADDPAVLEKQAQRRAIVEARKVREAERERKRKIKEAEEAARKAAEEAARQEQLRLEAELQEQLRLEEIARKEALEAEKKAERDARYAARKARKQARKTEIQRYR